MGVIQIF